MNPADADLHLSDSAGGPHDERLSWDGPYMAPAAVDAVHEEETERKMREVAAAVLTKPERRYVIEISVQADDIETLCADLRDIERRLRNGQQGHSVAGGSTCSHVWHLKENPAMTNERYFAELHPYLASLK